MLHERSRVTIIDNSGAQVVMLFAVSGKNGRYAVGVGDVVTGSVKKSSPKSTRVNKGDKVQVLITGTVKKVMRKDGVSVKFPQNYGVVLVKGTRDPLGTRVFAPIAREVKVLGYSKVASMAPEVV